jgi:hypothetical protein
MILISYLTLQTFAVGTYTFLSLLFTTIDMATLDLEQLRSLNWPFFLLVMTAAATHFLLVRHVILAFGHKAPSTKPSISAATANVALAGYPLWETVTHHWDKATHLFYGGIFLANALLLVAFAVRPVHDFIFRPRPGAEDGVAEAGG